MNSVQNSKEIKGCREKNAFFPFLPGSRRVHIRLISIPGALSLLWDAGLTWAMLPATLPTKACLVMWQGED